jgi:type II secretory pathway component PulF
MPVYQCRVVDTRGRPSDVVREAATEEALLRQLAGESLAPIRVRLSEAAGAAPSKRRRASARAVHELAGAMSLLLSSGLTLRDALRVAQTVYPRGPVNRMVVTLLEDLERGSSVIAAMDRLSDSVPALFAGFVRIGERVGSLEDAFRTLAEYMGRQKRLRERITSALIYPAVVLTVALAGAGALTFVVLPRAQELFRELGGAIPPSIAERARLFRVLLASALAAVVAAGLALPLLGLARRRSAAAAEALDRALLRVPGAAAVVRRRDTLSFVYAMETLVAGGFAVEDAMLEAAGVVANRWLRAGILRARERVLKGEPLSRAFELDSELPQRLARWVGISERSGSVQEVFHQLRLYYEGETEKWSERLMSLAEPVLILFVGAMIIALVLIFVVPLFSLYGSVL